MIANSAPQSAPVGASSAQPMTIPNGARIRVGKYEPYQPVHMYTDAGGPPGDCRICDTLIYESQLFLEHSPNLGKLPEGFRKFPCHLSCWEQVKLRLGCGYLYPEHPRKGW